MTSRAALVLTVLAVAAGLEGRPHAAGRQVDAATTAPARDGWREQERAAAELRRLQHQFLRWPDDEAAFAQAARTAWTFAARHYEPATGFITPLNDYPYATVWDIGSMLAAFYAGRALGLLDDAGYALRVTTLLQTLSRVPLYDGRVFNKAYQTQTGRRLARGRGASSEWGWSAIDLGRLLVWLKIVGTDPRFAALTDAVVRRNDFSETVRAGYLWGEDLDEAGRPRAYPEGNIGYEQYAALGFALWGYRAEKALRLRENALPVTVMGQALWADLRRWDRLTSEPFLLWGLEVGWDGAAAALARRLLLAQEARYRKTGFLTIAGEDAMPEPPHYFYYYSVYANGKAFGIETQDRRAVADGPRWVSAKSAFAFHALMPSRYTAAALQALGNARTAAGWASGVYEATGRSTGVVNLNTAAVILTAALVHARGEPVLAQVLQTTGESP